MTVSTVERQAEHLDAALVAIEQRQLSGECTELDAAKAAALMTGYSEKWGQVPLQVLSVDEVFRLPIVNPETGRSSRTYTQGGKFDGTAMLAGRTYLVEHKTCNEEIADPAAPYWRRLAIDSQVSMYALANWQDGRKIDGTMYDVIRKPTIRPKRIPNAEQKILREQGVYCGLSVLTEEITRCEAEAWTETPRLYGLRLLAEIRSDTNRYFQRRTVPRLDGEILEFAGEMWDVAQDIRQTQLKDRHYRNSGACMNFGRPCDFLGICSGYDTPDSDKWTRREQPHPEVDLSADVLTFSRIRCYQTCRRMHHYRYDLRLERVDEESAEALRFGQLLHEALAALFLAMKEEKDGYCNSEPAVSEAASSTQTYAF